VWSRPYDSQRLAAVYERGNAIDAASLRAWVDLILSFSMVTRPAVIDVGVGTGMFAAGLAEVCSPESVVGVDRSAAMLNEARLRNGGPRLRLVAGDAAALPLREDHFDLALLSRVIHHIPERDRCALELRRVLREHGVVVVRTTVREHLDALVYEYWPRLRELDRERFPALGEVVADFEAAGFVTTAIDSFAPPAHSDLGSYHNAMRLRPQSKFEQLSDEEFADGLAALQRDAIAQTTPRQVSERYDVLVFASR
jgi:ubiquinone/menaquinone biosynthesis C-methylase UbiE